MTDTQTETHHQTGKLLFKDGDWELRNRYPLARPTRIWHLCEGYWWYVTTKEPQCYRCKESPPTELVGLRNLQDWER